MCLGNRGVIADREHFLNEIVGNILLPYEVSRVYEEELIGEFENEFEEEYFNYFTVLVGRRGSCIGFSV